MKSVSSDLQTDSGFWQLASTCTDWKSGQYLGKSHEPTAGRLRLETDVGAVILQLHRTRLGWSSSGLAMGEIAGWAPVVKPKTLQIHAVSNSLPSLSCLLSRLHPSTALPQYLCCGHGSINISSIMIWAEERIRQKSKRSSLRGVQQEKTNRREAVFLLQDVYYILLFIIYVLSVQISSVVPESRKYLRWVCLF